MEVLIVSVICFFTLYFAQKVFFKPHLAFPIILGLGIIFQDLKLTELQIENKIIILAVVVSFFFTANKRKIPNIKSTIYQNEFHQPIYLLLISYLIVQSVRGSFEYWRGITSFYWALQFIILGYIGAQVFAGRYIFTNALLQANATRLYVTSSLCIYTTITLLLSILPLEIFAMVNINNPSFTVLFFPITLFMPIIFLSLKDGYKWEKICAKITWIFAFIWIIIASSRGALFSFVLITFMGIFYISDEINIIKLLKKYIFYAIVGGGFLFAFYDAHFVQNGIQTWLDTLQISEIFFKNDVMEIRDLDRLLHVQAAWNVLLDSWFNVLFGYGYRVSGVVLAPQLELIYANYLPNLNFESELGNVSDVATFGISSMMVDFGLVGVFGFLALFLVIVIRIMNSSRGMWRAILLTNLFFCVARLYGNNFLTYPLFYFALAPCGVFMYMINYHKVIIDLRNMKIKSIEPDSNYNNIVASS